jgi:nicotinate-nucleotide adenylyltransferase
VSEDVPAQARHYGIFGGTFDPPHIGHLITAQEVADQLGLDTLFFVPAADPPHKSRPDLTAGAHRLAMIRLAIAGDERFATTDVELRRAGPSYTVDTLRELRSAWGDPTRVTLVIGWDMLLYLPMWHNVSDLIALCDQIAAAARPGFDTTHEALAQVYAVLPALREKLIVCQTPLINVSSTDIRGRVRASRHVRYLVPEGVRQYIAEQRLYDPAVASGGADAERGEP